MPIGKKLIGPGALQIYVPETPGQKPLGHHPRDYSLIIGKGDAMSEESKQLQLEQRLIELEKALSLGADLALRLRLDLGKLLIKDVQDADAARVIELREFLKKLR